MSLDHLGWIAPDLAASTARWRNLGFTLSRQNRQMGFTGPGGALENWATANRIVAFREGYLELIGVIDAAARNPWTAYLARGEGPQIAAFRVPEADAAYPAIAAAVPGFDPPVQRRRMAALGQTEADGEIEMGFRNIFSQDEHWPEGRFIVIEHQNPEAIWQPNMLEHANGAKALIQAIFTAPNPAPTTERLAALRGTLGPGEGLGWLDASDDADSLAILPEGEFQAAFPAASTPGRPAVAGCVVRVENLAKTRACFDAADVTAHPGPAGSIYAAGADACGGVIAFTEGDAPWRTSSKT